MSEGLAPVPRAELVAALQKMHAIRKWFFMLGIVLIVVGSAAAVLSVWSTFVTILTLGVMLLFASGGQVASAIWSRGWEGVMAHLLTGLLYGILGFLMLTKPGLTAAVLTLLLAGMFLVGGVFRIVFSLTVQFHGWGWTLFSGIITLALGLMIWQEWPEASLWVIGLFVGIDLIFAGWAWVTLAAGLGRLQPQV